MTNHHKIFQNNENFIRCPECNGDIVNTNSEVICSDCGLVIEYLFNDSSYSFNEENNLGSLNKQFVSLGNRTDFIGGLGTCIDYDNSKTFKDKSGRILGPNEQRLYRRLKKTYGQFLRIKNHETEYRVFNILSKVSAYLNLNKNIKNNAAYYFKKITKNEEKIINNITLIAFCIFFAARNELQNAPITISEISQAFINYGHRVSPRLILRDALKYKKHLAKESKPHSCEDYIIRLIDNVIHYEETEQRLVKKNAPWNIIEYKMVLLHKSYDIMRKLTKWHRGGRNTFILTGAIIYLADKLVSLEKGTRIILTQNLISKATQIAEYSIRDHFVNLLKPIFINSRNNEK